VRYYDVKSGDGTRLRAWTNDAQGPIVLVSNGLGTNPHAWPSLLRPDCGLRVVGWNHRGTSGSARPADGRVDLDSYIEDALAVMDEAGIESAPVASWSAGVTVAFELLRRYPERVRGILAVAGVPGNAAATMLGPFKIPAPVARRTMVGLSRAGARAGHLIGPLTTRVPWTRATADMLRMSRLINPAADTEELRMLLQEFTTTDPGWYATLALGMIDSPRVSLSGVQVPTTFLAGRWDVLTGARGMLTAAQRIPHARYRLLNSTHFIGVEFPDLVLEELRLLLTRVEAADSRTPLGPESTSAVPTSMA
jgi:pimeloyl-ACP methyl ester carboxylesterase